MKIAQKLAVSYLRTKFKLLSSISKKRAAEKALELFRTPQSRNKKELPKIFEEAEKLQFDFRGVTIRGYRWNKNAGRKALIIHGFESSVINFDRYIKPLTGKGYELLAFDAQAHGRSGGKMISAPEYAGMIREVYDRFGPVHSFMAHSFGCLALVLALENIRHDENCRIVLIAPATESTTAADTFMRFLKLDDEVRKEFDNEIMKMGGRPLEWYSISRAIKNIKAKILWLHDEDDDITPLADALKVKEENFPNVEFVITKGLGHRRIYRDIKVSKLITDFM